jgi:hypothetical protein
MIDLRTKAGLEETLDGARAVIHLAELDPEDNVFGGEDRDRVLRASFGTYNLCQAARESGVDRLIVGGTLSVFDNYPQDYLIDELWQPRPSPGFEQLGPYIPELVAREFAREGGLDVICLRFDRPEAILSNPSYTMEAIDRALALPVVDRGYRSRIIHISRSSRFIQRNARLELGLQIGQEDSHARR